MRKYQQLFLLLISGFSVAVLLMYKSENNRLKYVLQVVNFFGRNDAAVLQRLDNVTKDSITPEFVHPMPVWQLIGDSFHAYSAYWVRNELVAGGEAYVIVTGKRGAVVNFQCAFNYDGGMRSVQGKFRFQRVDSDIDDANSDFTIYNFFCRLTRDFGHPESVSFSDITSNAKSRRHLHLRLLKSVGNIVPFSICLNLVNFNSTAPFGKHITNILQYFVHHQALGIDHFLIYNEDALPESALPLIRRTNAHLYSLPFNFPFSQHNATERIRGIIERDCLLRNSNHAKYTMILTENEFFYTNYRFGHEHSIVSSLNHYSADVRRFEVPTLMVCLDENKKLLIDNKFYNPEMKQFNKIYIYRLPLQIPISFPDIETQSIALTVSNAMAHRYMQCSATNDDGLHEWRSMLRNEFLKNLDSMRYEIELLV